MTKIQNHVYILLAICYLTTAGFITTNKPCATLKVRECLNNELIEAGTNKCDSNVGVLVEYSISHMEYTGSNHSSKHGESTPRFLELITKVETVKTNKGCRLTICDDKNLMGFNCFQFAPDRSYNLTRGNYPDQAESYLCVCEEGEVENENRTALWRTLKSGGESEFERNYMGVRFCADYFETDHYKLEEVRNMLLKIVTRFTHISVYTIDSYTHNKLYKLILNAAAEINAMFGYLILHISITPQNSWLTFAVQEIVKANQVFPGTVWGITADKVDLDCYDPADCLRYLRNETLHIINDDRLYDQLKFGYHSTYLPIEDHLQNISKLADYVVYVEYNDINEISNGTLDKFQKSIEAFAKLVAEVNPKMKVFTETGMESKGSADRLNKMLKFWHEVNKVGIDNQFYFIMNEALDQPNGLYDSSHMGWWTRHNVTGELVEKEKEEPEKEEEEPEKEEPEKQNADVPITEGGTSWLIILLVTLIAFLIIFGVASLMFWRRFRHTRNSRDDLKEMVLEFRKGSSEFAPVDDKRNYVVAIRAPYDPKHELIQEDIAIDSESVKTSRDGVTVATGTINNDNFNGAIILKSTSAGTSIRSIRHLLTEIKIYNYLGPHENVVRFIGAITSKIEKGVVQLALEFCPLGDLLSFLTNVDPNCLKETLKEDFDGESCDKLQVANSYVSVDVVRDLGYAPLESAMSLPPDWDNSSSSSSHGSEGNNNINDADKRVTTINLQQMCRWCAQIANAMDFLNKKDIIHADLAARNCLMLHVDHIKVSDFGLSKRQYVELGQGQVTHEDGTPLPFRWMPPESLKKLAFTSKSDVWSYGVTVWEILSLGQIPFPDIPFDQHFIEQLEIGSLRLPKPKFASEEIYDKLLDCWNTFPDDRPYFNELQCFFKDLLPVDDAEKKMSNSECDSDSYITHIDSTSQESPPTESVEHLI